MMLRRSVQIAVLTLFVSCAASQQARASLTLTSTAVTQGFTLSVFASGFPSQSNVGPLGIVFTSGGGVLVSDYPGNVRLFATDTDGQTAASATVEQNYGSTNAVGLAQVGGNLYMTEQGNGNLVQLNANGTFNQLILSGLPGATGLVADPITGHVYLDSGSSIYDVNPIAKTKTLVESGTSVDGLTLSSDGKILYGADTGNGHLYGFSTTTGAIVFDSGAIPGGIDGTALGTGSLLGNIFVNTNGGTVYELNLTTLALTQIASGGSRGDFVAVDPNGSLLLTQTDSIYRLVAPSGSGFGTVPEPTSAVLVALGCAGIALYARRRSGRSDVGVPDR